MDKETVHLVVVGHVDHGKSTLIGRLLLDTNSLSKGKFEEIDKIAKGLNQATELAFLVDQLIEERQQNRTIETTQIGFRTAKKNYVLIDVPGHREFIKNMLTGASMADAAVLVIDAYQGIKEQTMRHLYIIQLLGIKQVVVVLNKMDLVGYDKKIFEELKKTVLSHFNTDNVFIIPISAKDNENIARKGNRMNWFKGYFLIKTLDSLNTKKENINKTLAFPIQDIYGVGGRKIAVGTLVSGTIRLRQKVMIMPASKKATIREIIVFKEKPKKASAGQSIGLTFKENISIKRGDIIVQKGTSLRQTNFLRGIVFWLSREPLRINKAMTLCCATQEVSCFAEEIKDRLNTSTLGIIEKTANNLHIYEAGQLILKTNKPIIISKFNFIKELGRFVIVNNNRVRGIGIIT